MLQLPPSRLRRSLLEQQIISLCQPFEDLKLTFAVSLLRISLRTQQRIVDTKRVLWYKSMGFLGVIRPHHQDE